MKCPCGKETMFLVDGKCKECASKPSERKSQFVVRIVKDWFYDGLERLK